LFVAARLFEPVKPVNLHFMHLIKMKLSEKVLLFCVLQLFISAFSIPGELHAAKRERFDIIYILSKDLERVLDYKEELETIFGSKVRKKLKIVGKGDKYAIIYDANDTARSITKTLIEHGELLRKAGFDEAWATKEQDFHSLYNVSYGLGPNLDILIKRYKKLYSYLGKEVRKDLFIERTDYGNYTLIYRRRGSKYSTTKIAKRHEKLLRRKRIRVSVTVENNNTVVYGESSLINDKGDPSVIIGKKVSNPKTGLPNPRKRIVKTTPGKRKKRMAKAVSTTATLSASNTFEKTIESYINSLRSKGKISRDEATGWMVYDLASDKPIVDINADYAFQAASMIKPFVALAFFHQAKNGKFIYGPRSRRKMEAMIQRSNNSATNWIMRQVGGPAACERILKKYYSHIFKKTEITEYIPANGRTYRNKALPSDYVRFLRALWNKELPYGKEIRRLMALPGRDRLYHGTPIPQGTLVYNKTGSTAHLCGDMGILVPKTRNGGRYPYVIVGIIERRSRPSDYGRWMDSRSKVIRQVSTLVYKEMKKEHMLL
jgi:beta-lactamase class A